MVEYSRSRKVYIFVLMSANFFPGIRGTRGSPCTDQTKQHSSVFRDPKLLCFLLLTSFQIKLNQNTKQLNNKTKQNKNNPSLSLIVGLIFLKWREYIILFR